MYVSSYCWWVIVWSSAAWS